MWYYMMSTEYTCKLSGTYVTPLAAMLTLLPRVYVL